MFTSESMPTTRTIRCKRCGNMYEYEGLPPAACPECVELRNEQFQIVRALVWEFPGITALQVNQATEVPMDVILRFVEKGMLEVVPTANKDGKLNERIGLMIQKAKEIRQQYAKQEAPEVALDTLRDDPEKEKFTWHEGSKNG